MIKIRQIEPKEIRPSGIEQFLMGGFAGDLFGVFLSLVFFRKKKQKKHFVFDQKGISFESENGLQFFKYEDLDQLKIYYNSDHFNATYDYLKYSHIKFSAQSKKWILYFDCYPWTMKRWAKFLYKHRISFKEYRNEQRVFLGKKLKYKAIQKVKEKYGIEW